MDTCRMQGCRGASVPPPGDTREPARCTAAGRSTQYFGARTPRDLAIMARLGGRGAVLPDRVLPARFARGHDFGADARFRAGRKEPGEPFSLLFLLLRCDAGAGRRADRFL